MVLLNFMYELKPVPFKLTHQSVRDAF